MSLPTGTPDPVVSAPPYTWEAFRDASQKFARSAAANYAPDEAPFFYLHSGASLELGVKAALCRLTPMLLLEGQRFSDLALMRLAGIQVAAQQRSGSPRRTRDSAFPFTVAFAKAVERLELIYGANVLGVGDELETLKAARDLTAHGAATSSDVSGTMHRVLMTLATTFENLLPLLDMTPEGFWGDHHSLIARVLEDEEDAVKAQINALYAAAHRRFEERYQGVDLESIDTLMNETYWALSDRDEESRKCPVCGAMGMSHVKAELRREMDSGDRVRWVPGFSSIDFRCPICKLVLENQKLIDAARHFESFEPEADELDLTYWVEHFGAEKLDSDTREALGLEWLDDPEP